ncbi:MAG: hypothetical protein HN380_04265 [Victivallales bacterium]|nr:hypothetical protein [Victivallales bacterium]
MALRLHRIGPADRSGSDRIDFQLPPGLVADEGRRESLFQQFRAVFEAQGRVTKSNLPGAENWLLVEDWAKEGPHRAHYLSPHCDLTGDMFLGEKAFSPQQCHRLATQLVQALQALQAASGQAHGDLLLPTGELNREIFAFARHRRDDFGRLLLAFPLARDQVSGPDAAPAQRRDCRAIGVFIRALCCDQPTIFGKQQKGWCDLLQDLDNPSHDISLAAIATRLAGLRPKKSHPVLWATIAVVAALGTPLAIPSVQHYLRGLLLDPAPYYDVLVAWDSWLERVAKPLAELREVDSPPTDALRSLQDLDTQQRSWNAYDILTDADRDDVDGMELDDGGNLKSVDAAKIRRWVRRLSRFDRKRLDALLARVAELDAYFAEDSPLVDDLRAARGAFPTAWQRPRAYLEELAGQSNPEKPRRRAIWLPKGIRAIRTAGEISRIRAEVGKQIDELTAKGKAGEPSQACDSRIVPKLRDWLDSLAVSQGDKGTTDDLENARSQIEPGSPDRRAFDRLRESVANVVRTWELLVATESVARFEDGLAKKFPDACGTAADALAEPRRYLELFEEWENRIPRKEREIQWWERMMTETDRPTSISSINVVWRESRGRFLGDRPAAEAAPRYGDAKVQYLAAKEALDTFKESLQKTAKQYEGYQYADGSAATPISGSQAVQTNWKTCRESLANAWAGAFVRSRGRKLNLHGLPDFPKDTASAPDSMLTEYRGSLAALDRYFAVLNASLLRIEQFSAGKSLVADVPPASVKACISAADMALDSLVTMLDAPTSRRQDVVKGIDRLATFAALGSDDRDLRVLREQLAASIKSVDLLSKGIAKVGELAAGRSADLLQAEGAAEFLRDLTGAEGSEPSDRQGESARQALRMHAWWRLTFPGQDEADVKKLAEQVWEQVQVRADDDETVLARFQTLRRLQTGRRELATTLAKVCPTGIPDPDPTMRTAVAGTLDGWVRAEFHKTKVDASSLTAAIDNLSRVARSMGKALASSDWEAAPGVNEDALNEYAPLAGKLSEEAFREWADAVPDCVRLLVGANRAGEVTKWEANASRLEAGYERLNTEYGKDYRTECDAARQALDRLQRELKGKDGKGSFPYYLVKRNEADYGKETKLLGDRVSRAEEALDAIMSPAKWLAETRKVALRLPALDGAPGGQVALPPFEDRWTQLRGQFLRGQTAESLAGDANRMRFRKLRNDARATREQLWKANNSLPIAIELAPPPDANTGRQIRAGLQKARDALLATFLASAETREPAYWQDGKWAASASWQGVDTGLAAARDLASKLPRQLVTAQALLDNFHLLGQKDQSGQSLGAIRARWQPGQGATGALLREVGAVQTLLSRLEILAEIEAPGLEPTKLVAIARRAGLGLPEQFAAWERLAPASTNRWPRDGKEWQGEQVLSTSLREKKVDEKVVADRFSRERKQRWHRALAGAIPEADVFRAAAGFGVSGDESFAAWQALKSVPAGAEGLRGDLKLAQELWPDKPWQGVASTRWARVFSRADKADSIKDLATGKDLDALRSDATVKALDDRSTYNLLLARMKAAAGALQADGAGGAPDPDAQRNLQLWLGEHVGAKPADGNWPDTPLGKLARELWEKASADDKTGEDAGLDKAGPAREGGARGWVLAEVSYDDGQGDWAVYDGTGEPDWLKYSKGTQSIVFRKVGTAGASSYICTTEVSIRQVTEALSTAIRWILFWQTVPDKKLHEAMEAARLAEEEKDQREKDKQLRKAKKTYGQVNTILCWRLAVLDGLDLRLGFREEWFDSLEEVWTVRRKEITGVTTPDEEDPARWLGPTSCAYLASLYGCRLPTTQEWRQAAKVGGNVLGNACDRNWGNCYRAFEKEGLLRVGETDATTTPLMQGTFAVELSDETSWQANEAVTDDYLWFAPVGGTDERKVHYVLDNVAEFVCTEARALDGWLGEAGRPVGMLEELLNGTSSVAGGSALSPPKYCNASAEPVRVDGLGPATGYADVGFRLAFSASPPSPAAMVAKTVADANYEYPAPNP